MTSGRIFFFINKCELYIIVKKKKWATLGGLDTFCIWESEREKGEKKKIEKINFTFSLSGWAMPFQRWGPQLWEVLTLSPQPRSHHRRFHSAPWKNIP